MSTIARLLLSTILLSAPAISHAELTLDTKYLGLSQNFNDIPSSNRADYDRVVLLWKKQDKLITTDLLESGEILNDPEITSPIRWGGYGNAHAVFNSKDYYVRAFYYQTANQYREYELSKKEKRKSVAIPGGGACMLYVQDKDLNKAGSLKIALPENNFGTWCNGVDGLGAAGKGRDGVIVALSYYLTDKAPAKKAQDIGQGWRYMTVLIRWREENGKLILTQDDSCLGNPNKIKDIPSARKALDKCGV